MNILLGRVTGLLGLLLIGGCSQRADVEGADAIGGGEFDVDVNEETFAVVGAALNQQPTINDFVVYAQNSLSIRDRAQVNGGDVGVKDIGTGPFLEPNFELSVINSARVETSRSVIGDSVKLTNRSVVGDVQTSQLSISGSPTYAGPFAFPSQRPGVPALTTPTPGSTAVNVSAGQTRTLSPGAFGAVTVNSSGRLRLQAGTYDFASIQMQTDTRIEALGAVVIRVLGRFTGADRAKVVAATGVSPGSIRVEVSGKNGTTGALTATPKAAAFGNDGEITGLWLVPNGTLMTGQRSIVAGALIARDVYVDIDARVSFQTGFPEPACVPADCDDLNPCTVDQCWDGTCSHTAAAAGSSCADSDLCDGDETCNGAGVCAQGTAVVCPATDECHAPGTCDPSTGICSEPTEIEGACGGGGTGTVEAGLDGGAADGG